MRSGEVWEPKHHAVLDLNQPSMRLVYRDTALFPAKSDPAEDNNTVARVAPLFCDKLPLPELLINLLQTSMQPRSPLKRFGLEAADDLEVRVQLIRRKVPVASVPAFEPGLDQLDVLLRHRLFRQPGGFEGFGLAIEVLHPDDLTGVESVDDGVVALDLDPAALALGDHPEQGYDLAV